MIYLDNSATTKPKKELLDLHTRINTEYWCNTEGMYINGVKAHALLDKSARVITDTLKLKNKKVLFTSGAAEANNTAIYGVASSYYNEPKHIITTYLEHASVLNAYKDLEKRGFKVTYLIPNKEGIINIDELKKSITADTVLISVMWVNNIIGTIQPIDKIIEIVKKHPRLKLHVDAVQGYGKMIPKEKSNEYFGFFEIFGKFTLFV